MEPDPAGGGHGPEHPGGARGRRIQIHGRVCSLGGKMQVDIFHTIVIRHFKQKFFSIPHFNAGIETFILLK